MYSPNEDAKVKTIQKRWSYMGGGGSRHAEK